jgi:hypothetical protein
MFDDDRVSKFSQWLSSSPAARTFVRHPLFRFYRAGQTQYFETLASFPAIQKTSLVFHEMVERDMTVPFSWPIQVAIETMTLYRFYTSSTEGIVNYLLRPLSDRRVEALHIDSVHVDFLIDAKSFPQGLFHWPNLRALHWTRSEFSASDASGIWQAFPNLKELHWRPSERAISTSFVFPSGLQRLTLDFAELEGTDERDVVLGGFDVPSSLQHLWSLKIINLFIDPPHWISLFTRLPPSIRRISLEPFHADLARPISDLLFARNHLPLLGSLSLVVKPTPPQKAVTSEDEQALEALQTVCSNRGIALRLS